MPWLQALYNGFFFYLVLQKLHSLSFPLDGKFPGMTKTLLLSIVNFLSRANVRDVVVHNFDPSTLKAEAGGSL